jgi:hypothetical protein
MAAVAKEALTLAQGRASLMGKRTTHDGRFTLLPFYLLTFDVMLSHGRLPSPSNAAGRSAAMPTGGG